MTLPTPERGLIISYSYLWHTEYEQGRDEGVKDRPCVTIVAIEDDNGTPMVTVAPITHSMPTAPETAVEIPAATKRRLGLDDARSWGVSAKETALPGRGQIFALSHLGYLTMDFCPPS